MWAHWKCSSQIRGKGKECASEFSKECPKKAVSHKALGYKVKLVLPGQLLLGFHALDAGQTEMLHCSGVEHLILLL